MFRLFLTRILLKLLRVPSQPIDEGKIRHWLWTAMPQQGFADYITKRDITVLQQLGMGVQREEYLTLLGQRIEIGLRLSHAKKAFERVERDRKLKVEAIKKTPKERKIIKPEEKPQKNENITNKSS